MNFMQIYRIYFENFSYKIYTYWQPSSSFILYFLLMEIHIEHSSSNNQVRAGFVHSEENKQIIAEILSINAIR